MSTNASEAALPPPAWHARARLLTIVLVTIFICTLLGIRLYRSHVVALTLRECLRDDTVLAEDMVDADQSASITIVELIQKATKNIERRESLIARLRSVDTRIHKRDVSLCLRLLVTENEYLRARKLEGIALAASLDANSVSDNARQEFTGLCDRIAESDPYSRYVYRDSWLILKATKENAEETAETRVNEFLEASDASAAALATWLSVEKDCAHLFTRFSPSRNLYPRLKRDVEAREKLIEKSRRMDKALAEARARMAGK